MTEIFVYNFNLKKKYVYVYVCYLCKDLLLTVKQGNASNYEHT